MCAVAPFNQFTNSLWEKAMCPLKPGSLSCSSGIQTIFRVSWRDACPQSQTSNSWGATSALAPQTCCGVRGSTSMLCIHLCECHRIFCHFTLQAFFWLSPKCQLYLPIQFQLQWSLLLPFSLLLSQQPDLFLQLRWFLRAPLSLKMRFLHDLFFCFTYFCLKICNLRIGCLYF